MSSHLRLSSLILLVVSLSCDRVGQDIQPAEEEVVASANELMTVPTAPLAIDLTALADLKTATTFRLSKIPQSGEVSFTTKGVLLYSPDADYVAGDDEFTVLSDAVGKTLPPLDFSVSMLPDAESLPCDMASVTDLTETDANTPVTIDVLRNDTFCDSKPNPSSLQIETLPKSGSVRIVSGQVQYTPNRGFVGQDVFVYRVCPNSGSADCVLGAATVQVNAVIPNCKIVLNNDRVAFRQRFVTDSLVIAVQANDRLCKANPLLPLDLTVKPTGGTAYLTPRNTIVYKPQLSTTADKIHYRRCEGSTCLDATVAITVNRAPATCVMKANYNLVQLVLSKPTPAMRRRVIPINVLANDQICVPLRSVTIRNNPSNAPLQVLPSGVINYKMDANPKPKDITFTYALTDAQGKVSTATVKITIKP